ncbi:hypothetical protein G5V59_25190 [Nocardioides sp. W3-2-3]|uniref:hypothetical protein n=1 Tax=Nocardioides convexus TaxID=2712224 RepID=UPI0024186AED|nr:hypothetical protein [Nocardioides convexus]NHA01840.1 hypothetical protein [Nocardioides convexus]
MDPRQRAVNRRWRTKVAVFLAVGAGLVVAGLLLGLLPEPGQYSRGRGAPAGIVVIGVVVIVATLGAVVLRLVQGPQEPGKRARD